ncbi:RHS repeat-associated core domain protein [Anaerohalosphaera lusitana]|uniref:RHS repeat-associated core domain protein n=2 Tax=Anaerohalosphaera lusitana TaxID=1936003 RepID=A0A1U9NLJ6_9BACT|nr:RHS repeat-associated core domain protein [Anaerohalosphaera lusitana]
MTYRTDKNQVFAKCDIYGNYIDEVIYSYSGATGSMNFYLHDHLYSPVAIVNKATAEIAERCEYNAYGRTTFYTDKGADGNWLTTDDTKARSSSVGNAYTFTGRRLDTLDNGNLELMYYRHRYYDPQMGRFLQQDPWGMDPAANSTRYFNPRSQYKDSNNVYQYVKSWPVISVDPSGLVHVAFPGGSSGSNETVCSRMPCMETCTSDGGEYLDCWDKCSEAYNKFKDWLDGPHPDFEELNDLPCPCELKICTIPGGFGAGQQYPVPPEGWTVIEQLYYIAYLGKYHPGANWDMRSKGCPSQQCTYDHNGDLITHGTGAGTADAHNATRCSHSGGHKKHDKWPADWAMLLDGDSGKWPSSDGGCFKDYISKRPINNGNGCEQNP